MIKQHLKMDVDSECRLIGGVCFVDINDYKEN